MNRMKYCRIMENAAMTLEVLADKTDLSAGYLSHLENGSRENPSKETMEKIAAALGKTVPEVFFTQLTEAEIQELSKNCHTVEGGVSNGVS